MPSPTPNQKINQVKMFGEDFIEIVIEGDTFDDAFNAAKLECDSKNKTFIHPFNDERVIEDTLLWGFRLNFKPFENLEIGISRLAQWGGEGRPQSSSTFWNVLLGKDNCGAGGLDCGENRELEPEDYEFETKFKVSWKLTEKIRLYNLGQVSRLKSKDFYKAKIGVEVSL